TNSTGEDIQQALDRLPDGGEVVLGPGTYVVHQPIVLRHDHQTLRGSGPKTVLFLADGADCPVVILGSPSERPTRTTTNLRLANLTIDGNRSHQRVEGWQVAVDGSWLNNNGIDIWNVSDSEVEHVTCGHCRSGGLVTSAGVRRLAVDDFTAFDNRFDGLACYLTEDSRFTKLFLHDNLAAGISVDLAFNHNVITDALLSGNELGVFMRDSKDNRFDGLTILKSHRYGVFMAQTISGTRKFVAGTECIGNKFLKVNIRDCGAEGFLSDNASCTKRGIWVCKMQDTQTAVAAKLPCKDEGVRD